MHRGNVQEVAFNKDGTFPNPESNKNPVFKRSCSLSLFGCHQVDSNGASVFYGLHHEVQARRDEIPVSVCRRVFTSSTVAATMKSAGETLSKTSSRQRNITQAIGFNNTRYEIDFIADQMLPASVQPCSFSVNMETGFLVLTTKFVHTLLSDQGNADRFDSFVTATVSLAQV